MSSDPHPSDELRALLAACKTTELADDTALVLADWLEERGDPRGELVRVQAQRARLMAWAPEQGRLARREAALLRRHRGEWLGGLATRFAKDELRRGLLTLTTAAGELPGAECADLPGWEWVEGLEAVCTRHLQVPAAWPLLGRDITRLVVSSGQFKGINEVCAPSVQGLASLLGWPEISSEQVTALVKSPEVAGLTSLKVTDGVYMSASLAALLRVPSLERLRRLHLDLSGVLTVEIAHFATADLPSLTELRLEGTRTADDGLRLLLQAPFTPQLSTLDLRAPYLKEAGLLSLFHTDRLPGLTALAVCYNILPSRALKRLCAPARFPQLRSLSLRGCRLRRASGVLAAAPLLDQIERLDLADNEFGDAAVSRLLASAHLPRLRDLNLSGNRIGRGGIAALGRSGITGLVRLDLSHNPFSGRDFAALTDWFGRQSLGALNLTACDVGEEGIRALAEAPGLDSLCELILHNAGAVDPAALASARWLPGLITLNLSGSRLTAAGLEGFLQPGRLSSLLSVNLACCSLGDEGARLVAAWPDLALLAELDLSGNHIGDAGADALASSPYLRPTVSLRLCDYISEAPLARLRERLGARLQFEEPIRF